MNIQIRKLLAATFGFISCLIFAQNTSIDSTKNLKLSAFPVIFYTPETAFGFGGLGISTFRLKNEVWDTRPSSIQLGVSYTTKNQFLLYAPFEFYKDEERWRVNGELGFYKYFYNFYGIGPDSKKSNGETYASTFPRVRISFFREIFSNFLLGIGYELDIYGGLRIKEGGILEASNIKGKRNGTVSNIGIRAIYDTRDNVFFPTKGFYIQGGFFTSSRILGASFRYSKFELDNRYYQKLGKNKVIAANLFLANSSRDTPFYALNYLGSKRTRGFDDRRFQDNSELSFVLEYRFPIAGRFGGVLFSSTGTVAPNIGQTFSTSYKNAIGTGLRYIINKRDGVRIRADYGLTSEGGNFYLTLNEAF